MTKYCNLHGHHLGEECPECPYEAKIAELQSKLQLRESQLQECRDDKHLAHAKTLSELSAVKGQRDAYQLRVIAYRDASRGQRDALFDFVKHGDEKHRAWLREAIDAFYAGLPRPEPK